MSWGYAVASVYLTGGESYVPSHITNPISSWDGCNFNSLLLLQTQNLKTNIQKVENYTKQASKSPSVVSLNLCIRESLHRCRLCVCEEKNTVQAKVSDQFTLSLYNFSIFFSCLLTYPHIRATAHGRKHQPTVLASRALWGNVNQQKHSFVPGQMLGINWKVWSCNRKEKRTLLGLEKFIISNMLGPVPPFLLSVIYCPQPCQNLMKNTDLRSCIFSVVYFIFGFNKILPPGSGTSVVFFKNPLEKKSLTIFHKLSN